ncbi:four helix bundle protein [bacterium]|nr:four helix bundle protein [bacterium]
MSLQKFRSYQLAVEFYRKAREVRLPLHLQDQLLRASSSIVLNLAEGSAKGTHRDRVRFYRIALGSQRECCALLDLVKQPPTETVQLCDKLGGHIYRLVNAPNS